MNVTAIIDTILCFFSSAIITAFLYGLLCPRKLTKWFAPLVPIVVSCSMSLFSYSSVVAEKIENPSLRQNFVFGTMGLAYLLFVLLGFSSKFKEKILAYCSSFIVVALAEFPVSLVIVSFNFITGNPKEVSLPIRLVIDLLALLFYGLNAKFFYVHFKKKPSGMSTPVYFSTMGIAVSSALLILLLLNVTSVHYPTYRISAVTAFCSTLLLVASLVSMLFYISKQEKRSQEILGEQKLQEAEIQHIQEVYKKSETMRKVQHDLKDSLSVAQMLLQEGTKESTQKAYSILEDLNQKVEQSHIQIYTHNVLLNTVLSAKIEEANKLGIHVDPDIQIPPTAKGIRDIDLALLIVNLFNNAIEACQSLKSSTERIIRFHMVLKGNFLIFKLSNPYTYVKVDKGGMFKTTKADEQNHGVGMAIVKGLVQKYHGEEHITTENQIFTHTLSLELNENLQ